MKTVIPSHLPEHLTISFVIWGLFDPPEGGVYHDLEKMVDEHIERGFNCIRLEDGAGFTHFPDGTRRPPVDFTAPFGKFSQALRQFEYPVSGGKCDLLARLIALAEICCRKHVFLILSSWYFLHTYWLVRSEADNDYLYSLDPLDRFQAFAEFLDFIIQELKRRRLDKCLAFAEICNEADGLRYMAGKYYQGDGIHFQEQALELRQAFREKHTQALNWLRSRHPDILFAYDTCTQWTDEEQMPAPGSFQIWDFHNYFLWQIYTEFETLENLGDYLIPHPFSADDVRQARNGKRPLTAPDWYDRAALYNSLAPEKISALQIWFHRRLRRDFNHYIDKIDETVQYAVQFSGKYCPDARLVAGEGVSYVGCKMLQWEECSEQYWLLLEHMMKAYREAGLWGTVVRTCCGPEDPCWDARPETLKRLNRLFLEGDVINP